jgi:hypothetical protein
MATSLVAWDCSPQVGLDRLMQLQLLHPLSELSSGARLVRGKGHGGPRHDQADHQHHGFGYQDSSRDRDWGERQRQCAEDEDETVERTRHYSGMVHLLAPSQPARILTQDPKEPARADKSGWYHG